MCDLSSALGLIHVIYFRQHRFLAELDNFPPVFETIKASDLSLSDYFC